MISPTSPTGAAVPRWFWVGLVLLHSLFLGFQLQLHTYFFPDADRYVTEAANISRFGEAYARPLPAIGSRIPQEYTIRPPGYPLFLLALGGTRHQLPAVVLLGQNILSILNLGLLAGWLRQFQLSRRQWRLLLAGVVLYPAQLIYANVVMSEMLLQTAVIVLWLNSLRFWQYGQTRHGLLAALAATAALLIKPVFYPFSLLVLLLGAWAALRHQRPALTALAALPLLVALLYQVRNYERTGFFHFSSIAYINLLHYNVEGVLRRTEGAPAADQFIDQVEAEAAAYPTYAARQAHIQARSLAVLRQYPVVYARQHVLGMVNCFLDPGRFDLVHFFAWEGQQGGGLLGQYTARGYGAVLRYVQSLPLGLLLLLLLLAAANVLRLVALVAFLLDNQHTRAVRLSVGLLLLYVAALTGPLGAARFAVPVFPVLLAGAVLGSRRLPAWRPGK